MIDGVPVGILANGIGVIGVVVWLYLMLASGRLVTRREAEAAAKSAQQVNDDLRADRDIWRDNFLDQKGLMSQILVGQETTNRLLRAIPHVEDHE